MLRAIAKMYGEKFDEADDDDDGHTSTIAYTACGGDDPYDAAGRGAACDGRPFPGGSVGGVGGAGSFVSFDERGNGVGSSRCSSCGAPGRSSTGGATAASTAAAGSAWNGAPVCGGSSAASAYGSNECGGLVDGRGGGIGRQNSRQFHPARQGFEPELDPRLAAPRGGEEGRRDSCVVA